MPLCNKDMHVILHELYQRYTERAAWECELLLFCFRNKHMRFRVLRSLKRRPHLIGQLDDVDDTKTIMTKVLSFMLVGEFRDPWNPRESEKEQCTKWECFMMQNCFKVLPRLWTAIEGCPPGSLLLRRINMLLDCAHPKCWNDCRIKQVEIMNETSNFDRFCKWWASVRGARGVATPQKSQPGVNPILENLVKFNGPAEIAKEFGASPGWGAVLKVESGQALCYFISAEGPAWVSLSHLLGGKTAQKLFLVEKADQLEDKDKDRGAGSGRDWWVRVGAHDRRAWESVAAHPPRMHWEGMRGCMGGKGVHVDVKGGVGCLAVFRTQ